MTSIMTILENGLTDLNTNVVQLAIYNYKSNIDMSDEFRVGRYVIIKNPYYKIYSDEWPGLRIDNPNELFFVDDKKIISELKEANKVNAGANSTSTFVEKLDAPPKWKIIVTDFTMTERALHAGFVHNDSTIFYWGGISNTEKDLISRQMSQTYGELIMLDTYSNMIISPIVSGEIPEPGRRNTHVFISDFEANYAYLFGGGDAGENDGSFRLCLKTFKWKKLNFKFNLTLSNAASVPGFIYIYGGRKYTNDSCENVSTFFRYDIKNDKLQKLNISCPHPAAKSKSCMTSICNGKYLLLYGGDGSRLDNLNDLWLFDCSSLEWIELSNLSRIKPPPMTHCDWTKVKINGKERALVFYGGTGMNGIPTNDIWSLDLNTFNWEKIPTSSKNMEALSCYCNHVSNMRLYVYGGMDRNKKLSSKVYCFNLSYHFRNVKDLEYYAWQCVECHNFTFSKTSCKNLACCLGKCEENYSKRNPEPSLEKSSTVKIPSNIKIIEKLPSAELSEMDNLKKTLSDRETQVLTLEKSVSELTLKNSQANHNLEMRNRDLIDSNLKYEKRIETLNLEKARLEQKHKEYEKKIKEMEEKTRKIPVLEKKCQQAETKLQEMTQFNKQVDLEREILKKKMLEQSNTIETLHQESTNQKQEIATLKRACNELEYQTQDFLLDLEEKEKENQELIRKLAKYYEDLDSNQHVGHSHQQELFECIICMDNKVDHVSVPCGHLFCSDCISNQVNCPTCRGKIESKVKVFLN